MVWRFLVTGVSLPHGQGRMASMQLAGTAGSCGMGRGLPRRRDAASDGRSRVVWREQNIHNVSLYVVLFDVSDSIDLEE